MINYLIIIFTGHQTLPMWVLIVQVITSLKPIFLIEEIQCIYTSDNDVCHSILYCLHYRRVLERMF